MIRGGIFLLVAAAGDAAIGGGGDDELWRCRRDAGEELRRRNHRQLPRRQFLRRSHEGMPLPQPGRGVAAMQERTTSRPLRRSRSASRPASRSPILPVGNHQAVPRLDQGDQQIGALPDDGAGCQPQLHPGHGRRGVSLMLAATAKPVRDRHGGGRAAAGRCAARTRPDRRHPGRYHRQAQQIRERARDRHPGAAPSGDGAVKGAVEDRSAAEQAAADRA